MATVLPMATQREKLEALVILKPCPFCQKDIPRSITVCPYCHRDEGGKAVQIDTAAAAQEMISPKEFDQILRELASEDSFQREQAVLRMSQLGSSVVPGLVNVLSDFAKPGLAGAAKSLGKIGDKRAIPVLAQAAKMGDDDLRVAAIWALSQFHEPEILPILLSEAERSHPVIQSFLAYTLGSFQDARVVPMLAKLSGHPNREVAFQAASALGEVGDRHAIPVLRKAWRKGDDLLRTASASSLRRLGSRPSWLSPSRVAMGMILLVILGAGAGWLFYR